MAGKSKQQAGHTGFTTAGNTRDVKVAKIDKVTIYRRGRSYYLYYRQDGASHRPRIDGNLATARATASKVAAALVEERPSPLGFQRTAPSKLVADYLDYVENVQGLAWRTVDRYRAALDRYLGFCTEAEIASVDAVGQTTVEDFVRSLRGQTRTRNGCPKGKRDAYKVGGIKFILSTCRTAYNWATRRRMLPPYSENPFTQFPIDQLRDADGGDEGEERVFTPQQEAAFFAACSEWQRVIFRPLATYGMRVGELTHLLVENVDFGEGTIKICSKPEAFWKVKTARTRKLPLTAEMAALFKTLIGRRRAGFVFLNDRFYADESSITAEFDSDRAFREHLVKLVADMEAANPQSTKRDKRRVVVTFCRAMGQIPVKRVQAEFCKLTEQIGCPQFTRTHDLRHLFTTRAQERGANPILVQQIVGHQQLDMTKRYTHLGMDAKRDAIEAISAATTTK